MSKRPHSVAYPQLSEEVEHNLLPGISLKRLDLFLEGPYNDFNLTSVLDRIRLDDVETVRMTIWSAPTIEKVPFEEAVQNLQGPDIQVLKKGDLIGGSWSQHWVKVEIMIPVSFRESDEPVVFEFDPSCEALIFDRNGHPLHGITGGPNSTITAYPGYVEDRRIEHIIPREAVQAGKYECYIEVACNGIFGIGINGYRHHEPDMNMKYHLASADLVQIRSEAHALQVDFQILKQFARSPEGEKSSLSRQALKAANEIMNVFSRDSEERIDESIRKGRTIAMRVIGASVTDMDDDETKIWAIGHCHIDTGWLWRYAHTQQKIARSWSTQIDLMDRYPEHQFTASSAQQYVWLEQLYPTLFQKVKRAVLDQKFHPIGGSWLEHDCVLPSGESLIRQYLYGQRWFEEKFGVRSNIAWLPDTFGYASQLPQILRLAGIDYFFTQKLSWNNINIFPHSTFNWSGLDGSRVLAHMTPTDTYNAQANFSELQKGIIQNKNLESTDQCLLLFGNGDGGGGPISLMLEKLRRLNSSCKKNQEIPKVKIASAEKFFEHLCETTDGGKTLSDWKGELYFELHRGIFTSQAKIKNGNQTMEKLLRDVEYFATIASFSAPNYEYPKDQLDDIWHDVMLNHFHDVLPGTSIKMVNDDAIEIYEKRTRQAQHILDQALRALFPYELGEGGQLAIFDGTRIPRQQVVEVPHLLNHRAEGEDTQVSHEDSTTTLAYCRIDNNGIGSLLSPDSCAQPSIVQDGSTLTLSNSIIKLTISNGRITSLYDSVLGRELVTSGVGGIKTAGLMIYDDYPLSYDAWDAEIYHLKMGREILFDEVEVLRVEPLRSTIRTISRFGKSEVVLDISIDAMERDESQRPSIRIDAKVNWHETHKFLKFALPLDIHSSTATYGTQFGIIERPTHRNTSIDQAKFEVPAHMFADLSESGYGVSLISNYKYGYAVEGNTMRISLLRSATAPDVDQDRGYHEFTFNILPHLGRLVESGVYKRALTLTNPLRIYRTKSIPKLPITFDLQQGNQSQGIILETIKRGENDFIFDSKDRTIILRLYESLGGRSKASLRISGIPTPKAIKWLNVLEEPELFSHDPVQWETKNDSVEITMDFRCFEIKTLGIYFD
ncbi:uncharacterized protein I206_105123 [Kwoniella pini CBS 10737]|uniref:alpha-mannosidase n=1 Tax=Kwoniella pini CBS 10737 TaxID=1296096 RepID=A0A1B9I8N7_9TREE|nr:uncharacterized protein I206_02664 [Kwoniella pini CBS 10737]OCF51948.1 hypothetical protein I206_02664 [Kwoniella pini CBS 10737]